MTPSASTSASRPAIPADFSAAHPHLRPLLRGRWHIEMPRLQAAIEGADYSGYRASLPFCQDAVILLGYDLPDRTLQIDADQLARWNVSFQDASKIALQNLRAWSAPRFQELRSGVRVGDWADGYEVSRILLPELMRQCGIDDDLIMMVPSRRAGILVAPARSEEAQLWMLGCSRQLIEAHGGLVSAAMFRYRDRRIVTYQPQNPQLAEKLNQLQMVAASALYGEQKAILETLHSRQRKDIFVASYQVGQGPGPWLSACTWTQGLSSLLPKTELVCMVKLDPHGGDQHQTKVLDWETMCSLAGDRLQPVDTFPPRFRASGFPPEDALARSPAFRR